MSLDKNETANVGRRLVHEPSELEIRTELQAVLSSLTFREQERPRRMLSYLVDECLAGRSSGLKAYTIAVDVFGRGPNFDQSTDAVVRVHASRLRGMLTQHYSGDGHMCRVRIGLPKGSYVPTFTFAGLDDQTTLTQPVAPQIGVEEAAESQSPALPPPRGLLDNRFRLLGLLSILLALFGFGLSAVAPREPQSDVAAINSIGLVPIWTSSESPELSDYAAQLGKELLRTISTSHYISLKRAESLDSPIPSSTALKAVARSLDVRWLLFGTLAMEQPGGRRVVMSIVDGLTGRFVWSTAYDEPVPNQSSSERADAIIADIRPLFLALSRRALEIAGSAHYSPLEHFLLSTWTSGTGTNRLDWELERVAIARAALNAEPRFGPAHAVLSDKLAYLANVDFPSDTDNNRLEARMHAHAAIESSPDMAEAVFNVSAHHWHAGNLNEALNFSKRTLDLSPEHLLARLHVLAVPYTCKNSPPDVIREIEGLDRSVSASNPIRWVILSWIARLHLNNGDFERAVFFARSGDRIFRTPDTFIQMAAALVRTGQNAEAQELLDSQRSNWPNLDINHYVGTTLERRCREQGMTRDLHQTYQALLHAMR